MVDLDTVFFVMKVKDVKRTVHTLKPYEQREIIFCCLFPLLFDWIFAVSVKTTKVLLSYCTVLRYFLKGTV